MPEQNIISSREIRDFTKFLEKCLGRKVDEYSLKNLTKPGDHYGSIIQSVSVKVFEKNSFNEVTMEREIGGGVLKNF